MGVDFFTIEELIQDQSKCPFPLEMVPNFMGINLCSVSGVLVKRKPNGDLIEFSVVFK